MVEKNHFEENRNKVTNNIASIGSIIIRTENLRTNIRNLIALNYFSSLGNKCFEIIDFLIGDAPQSQIQMKFKYLLNKVYCKELEKVGITKDHLKTLKKHLKTCLENRNELAHSHTVTGYDLSKGKVEFKTGSVSVKMIKSKEDSFRNNFVNFTEDQLQKFNVFVGMVELSTYYLGRVLHDIYALETEPQEHDIQFFIESLNECVEIKVSSFYKN